MPRKMVSQLTLLEYSFPDIGNDKLKGMCRKKRNSFEMKSSFHVCILFQVVAKVSEAHISFCEEGVMESESGAHVLRLVSHWRNVFQVVAK